MAPTPVERRALKARAHHLNPVVMVSDAGLTPPVLREIDRNLASHELIKIRVFGDDRAARAGIAAELCAALGAHTVQLIGKIMVIFRPRPPEGRGAGAAKPARRKRKPARRTKRSYQRAG